MFKDNKWEWSVMEYDQKTMNRKKTNVYDVFVWSANERKGNNFTRKKKLCYFLRDSLI